ncbi:hypothetical protein BJ165DRAFT_1058674 [Panaeolus papilionaceus]|nr:hypothetical protein BJ165DRAFT_1058674 [Panaeolus papilionaceus]
MVFLMFHLRCKYYLQYSPVTMWSRISSWLSPFIEVVKEKVSLFVKIISPTLKQDLSACPSVGRSVYRHETTPLSFIATLFKPFSQTPASDIEKATNTQTEDVIIGRRFSRPKKWIGARPEQKRESCTTIPSFFVGEASQADDEWHIRYRRDVLGIVSPPTQASARLPSATSSMNDVTTPEEPSPLSYTNDSYGLSPNDGDIPDESDISDEVITPSSSSDSPLTIQIFSPRISNTPTIDNLAMGLHTPFTPDRIQKPLPIDTDPYDLMFHLFGDEFTRMDEASIAKLLATNEIFSVPTASVGLAIELALSNENVLADIPWVPARSTLTADGLARLSALSKSSCIQRSSRSRVDGDIAINPDAPISSSEDMPSSHVSFMEDSADFVVTKEAGDSPALRPILIPMDEGINTAEIHDADGATPPTTIMYRGQSPSLPNIPTNDADNDTLEDFPLFMAMAEQAANGRSTGNGENNATSPLEFTDVFSSPDTLTSNSSPELSTPVQTTDIDTSPSVYSCRTLDHDMRAACITDDAQGSPHVVKLEEQHIGQALDESEDLEDDRDIVIRYKRQGVFIPVPPPPAPSQVTRTPSVRQPVSMIPLRGVNVRRTRLPIRRSASKPSLSGFVNAVVQAASLRPSRPLETVKVRTTTPSVQLAVEKQDPFAHLNSSFHADRHCMFKADISNLDIYRVPSPKPLPPTPKHDTEPQDPAFTDLIPTYVYDYSALNTKNDSSSSSNSVTAQPTPQQPQKSFLMDNLSGCPTQATCPIIPINTVGSRFRSTYPKPLPNKPLSILDIYDRVSHIRKQQKRKHCQNFRLTTITEHLDDFSDDTPTTDSSSEFASSSDLDDCYSPLSGPHVTPPSFVTCPLISISPPSVSSICLDLSLSVPVPFSVSDFSSSTMDSFGNERPRLLSICTVSTRLASLSTSSRYVSDQTLCDQGKNIEPSNHSVAPKEILKHKRRNFTITCPDDLESSRRTLADMRINDPPLPRLLPPAPISGADDHSIGLPALEDILVVNENYVSGLALPEGSPPRRVSAPSTCPFAAAAAAAAARAAALGEIRHSGSNVPISAALYSRRQSVVHAHREPRICNKPRKRPLHLVAKTGNITSNLKPLVLPIKLALREANEVNMRLSSKLEALGTPDLSYESATLVDSRTLESNISSSTAIAALIELLDAAGVPQVAGAPSSSHGSSTSSRRISPEWGVAF